MVNNFLAFRIACYFRENGPAKTIVKALELIRNSIFRKRFLFYVDLQKLPEQDYILPKHIKVEHKNHENEITDEELKALTHHRKEKVVRYQLKDRFGKGARLWLVKLNDKVVGIVWSSKKVTIESYYFPLTNNDIHIFDNEIFRNWRGMNINPHFINYVLFCLKKEGMVRAYIETRVNNLPAIRSLAKTRFSHYGSATKWNVFGCNVVFPSNLKK